MHANRRGIALDLSDEEKSALDTVLQYPRAPELFILTTAVA
jgi:hypothetical protein